MNGEIPNPEGKTPAVAEATVAEIAQRLLRLDTLETHNRDALDFHTLAVWAIRDALLAAYAAGASAALNHKLEG